MTELAIAPPIGWRQPESEWPPTPAGYRLVVARSMDAGALGARYGVQPTHVGYCTYALWVRDNAPACTMESPIATAARQWIQEVGTELARSLATEGYPFGRARIIAHVEQATGKPWPWRSLRARDVFDFFEAVCEVLKAAH